MAELVSKAISELPSVTLDDADIFAVSHNGSSSKVTWGQMRNEVAPDSRYLFMGDSWATGYIDGTNTTTGWPDRIKSLFGLSDSDYFKIAQDGCAMNRNHTPNFYDLLNANYSNVTNPETITHVVCGCGLNDTYDYTYNDVATGIYNWSNLVKRVFPKAKIYLFAVGWTMFGSRKTTLKNVFAAYNRACQANGVVFVDGCQYLTMSGEYFPADNGSHVNDEGQLLVSRGIANYLCGGTIGFDVFNSEGSITLTTPQETTMVLAEARYEERRKIFKFSNNVISFPNNVSIPGWNSFDLGTISSNLLHGMNSVFLTFQTTARIRSGTTYTTVPVGITFIQDSSDWHKATVRMYTYASGAGGNTTFADVDQVKLATTTHEASPYYL